MRARIALLVTLALLAVGTVATGALPARAARAGGVVLTLSGVSPAALDPGHDLVVRGTLRNTGSKALKDAGLALRLHTGILGSRDAITGWLTDGTSGGSRTLPGDAELKTVPPGASRPFKLTVPKGRTGLATGSSAFGPRALEVVATAGGRETGTLRTTVVWSPTPDAEPVTRLSLLAPVTASSTGIAAGAADRANADLITPGGRLQRVLAAAADPEFDWAIDPATLQAASRIAADGVSQPDAEATGEDDEDGATGTPSPSPPAGATPSPTGGDAAERRAAAAWVDTVQTGRADRSVLGLPYADPDLNSLLDNGRSDLLQVADDLGRSVTSQVLGQPLDTTVAWPGDGRVAGRTIAGLGRLGRTDVVMASGSQPPDPAVDFTATGRSTMRSSNKILHGLLYDEDLSALVTDATGEDPAAGTQTLLAQLAAIAREQPDTARHLLAVTPRTWDPDPVDATAMVKALNAAPWVSLKGLDELRTQDVSTVKRSRPSYGAAARRSELPVGQLTAIARLNGGLQLLAPALVDRATVLPPLQEHLASLLSYSWRREPEALSAARLDVARIVAPVTSGVRLLTGSQNRTVIGKSASIPVFVQNSTPYAVRVVVRLRPRTGQLTIKHPVTAEIAPGSRGSQVLVPAEAIADGNVEVEAGMYATSGEQLGTTEVFRLRVRPNWETRGMVGAAAVLGLLLVFGLLRSFLRDRTRVPPEAVPDVDDLASRRADVLSGAPATGAEPADAPTDQHATTDQTDQTDQQESPPSEGADDRHRESPRDGTAHPQPDDAGTDRPPSPPSRSAPVAPATPDDPPRPSVPPGPPNPASQPLKEKR